MPHACGARTEERNGSRRLVKARLPPDFPSRPDAAQIAPIDVQFRDDHRMSSIWRRFLISLSASLALAGAAAAADCDALIASFKSAIADQAFEKVKDAMGAIADDSACNFNIDAYRIQEINSIIDMAGAAPTDDARKQMIEFVEGIMEIGGDWRSAEHLGDYHAHRGEYEEALGGYETAISFLSRAAPPATPKDREELLARAAAAKSQASDDQEGPLPIRLTALRGPRASTAPKRPAWRPWRSLLGCIRTRPELRTMTNRRGASKQ